MPYADGFRADPGDFLKRYALMVNGALSQNGLSGQTVRQQLLARPTHAPDPARARFDFTQGSTHAVIGAPLLYAYFSQMRAAESTEFIPWSVEQIVVNLDNAAVVNGVHGLPIYLIPYEGGRTLGVRLPAGDGPAIALTATQNGCTVEVSGEPGEPYASHSNVINVPGAYRQAAIIARAQRLQNAYNNAIDDDEDMNDPGQNRSMFGHYTQVPGFTNRMVDYTLNTQAAINGLTGPDGTARVVKGTRRGHGLLGHSRNHLTVTANTLHTMRNAPSQALVVGVRRNAAWRFHFQSWMPMGFRVNRARKWSRFTTGTEDEGVKHATVVLSFGTVWPEATVEFQQFS